MFRFVLACSLLVAPSIARADELVLYSAGSLRGALTAIVKDFTAKTGIQVRTAFGSSGLMREKIEKGDKVDLFTSADMGNALKLRDEGRAAAAVMFTRNQMCAFALPEAGLSKANFAERLLDPAVKLGTSTPLSDPSGDYAWAMFRSIDKQHTGAFAILEGKAQKLVGGAPASSDPDPIGTAFHNGRINVMIGYCSGAEQQRAKEPTINVVEVPDALTSGPEYGMALSRIDNPDAVALALAILSPEGQVTLGRFGLSPIGRPTP